jgi:hypothetical protein
MHPWESAYLVIRADPYAAITAKDGSFTIADIPDGTHAVQFWHERAGYLRGVAYAGGTADRRGRAVITVQGSAVNMGVVKVKPSLMGVR